MKIKNYNNYYSSLHMPGATASNKRCTLVPYELNNINNILIHKANIKCLVNLNKLHLFLVFI